ncbi:class I SAM-dependent DNA methyltransferase [Actinocatenispora rupis]|uniref:Methyltransferase n=1 Tax=Actinocatenispora rupis TaxID=519421 RepID=A0A8J3J748_9ACTN|nr:class I SAM-dependent methyltransferase [Actinocatenispora rupis]GID10618.1 methyltransferase [Actinocatenispora rupis]
MTEHADVTATRTAYDTVAADYADLLRTELAGKPLERGLLGTFAELVGPDGEVGDLGCGPGRVTAYLDSLGLRAFGVDLSPGMVEVARRDHPTLRFEVGTIADLDLPDGALAGIVAWYSIIHTPRERLPGVFAEFHRVLAPGGRLLLAFQLGDEIRHIEHGYGHDIVLDAYRLSPDRVTDLLADAGLTVDTRVVRQPEGWEPTPQAYLLGHKG